MTGSAVITVLPLVVPSVTINSSRGDTVCAGTPSTFTALPLNGGSAPVYLWTVNGGAIGGSGPTYTYSPANGDVVTAVLSSSAACALPDTASNSVTMSVITVAAPSVTISANPGGAINPGDADTLVATVTNGGGSPAYQWRVNNISIAGANSNTYVSGSLVNGDSVACIVTNTSPCGLQTGEGIITITVNNDPGVGVKTITGAGALQLLPNPNKGAFTIKGIISKTNGEELQIEVTDMLGQVIYANKIPTQNGWINEDVRLNSVANGMYLLHLRAGANDMVFHFVMEQ